MKNFKSSESLLKDAERHYKQLLQAYEEKWWNIVIRRAQEVVELSLKGVLKMECTEYPKVHDIGPVFVKIMKEKNIDIEKETYKKIEEISDYLAKERGPSFYGEKDIPERMLKRQRSLQRQLLILPEK